MFLVEKTLEVLGKTFDEANQKDKLFCKCDYCGIVFQKTKQEVKRSRKYTNTDACKDYKCIIKKREETNLLIRGVKSCFQSEETKQKIKETHIRKYGTENPMQNESIKQKQKETIQKEYGVDNVFAHEKTKQKIKETHIKNLGVENPMQNESIKQKQKETIQKKYGVNHYSKTDEYKIKVKETNTKNYGVEWSFQSLEIQEKIKKVNIEKYESEFPMRNKEVQEKFKNTCIENLGVENPSQNKEVQERIRQTCINLYGKYPVNNYGKTQNEIKTWLNSFGYNFQPTYQLLNGKEIDLYDENKKIAIEYCGLYWHNELSPEPRNRDYHYEKYKICLEKDIQLITIFEDEWINREFQCKSHLKSVLGVIERKIFARKCIIKEISILEAKDFFNKYHIQGCNSLHIITFGLFYEEELVSAISLGRHNRQNIDNSIITLDRLCFKDGVQVIGGASRLFSQCIKWSKDKGYKQILSFSDNRWSLGNVYKVLNFVLDKEYKPDYSYVNIKNSTKRLSKQCQSKKASNCPVDKTEYEWALERGLGRIWDCGKKRWIFTID